MTDSGKSINGWVKACSVSMALSSLAPGVWGEEVSPRTGPPNDADETLGKVLNLGPFEIRPHVTGSVLYDDNIHITSTDPLQDVVWTISPGLLVGVGDYRETSGNYLALDYTPSVILFTDHDENDSLDHNVNFYGQWKQTKLSLGLGQSYQLNSGGLVRADTSNSLDREISSQQVDREVFVTVFRAKYDLSDKTSFEINGSQILNRSEAFIPYNEWVNQDWMNYHATDKIDLGVGLTLGFLDIGGDPNQTYQQGLLRAGYTLTQKVSLNGSIGVEFRQFQDGPSEDPSFIFSLGGFYSPGDRTTFGLEAYRQNQNSVVLPDQNYTVTGLVGSVRQQLLDKFYITLSGGYQDLSYDSISGSGGGRNDDYFFVGPSLDYNISEGWSAGVFYQYRQNSSSDPGAGFENNQAGLRSSFRF